MKRYEVKDHEPSYLPEGEWKLVWHDEFDGTQLDQTKWGFRLNFWGKPFDAYTDQGIVLDGNSHVELHRTQRNGKYVSPQLQTGSNSFDIPKSGSENPWKQDEIWPLGILEPPKFVHRYGYYECRCKFQKDPATMWSAFWVQSPTIGARFEPQWCGVESDIMECFATGTATTGNIFGGYGQQFQNEGRVHYDLDPGEWHYFGMDWQPDKYVFYYNGREISRCTENISQVPEFILLTTEIQGYRGGKAWEGKEPPYIIQGEFTDDCFIADFVRVFDRVE